MSYIFFLLKHLLDLPKTVWINFKALEFKQAIYLPIILSRKVKVKGIYKYSIEVPEGARTFSIKIGIEGAEGVAHVQRGCLVLGENSKLIFNGRASISKGILIRNSGSISFGNNFYCNHNLSLICVKKISFGSDCILGWNIHIRDCDGHPIFQNGERINSNEEVIIGNRVWIGQDVKVLKGVNVLEGSIIAMNSCVTKKFIEKNILIGGYPAKVIKQNVEWEV